MASRLKDYVRAVSSYNTSEGVLEPLSEIVRSEIRKAIEKARSEGRKTVRLFLEPPELVGPRHLGHQCRPTVLARTGLAPGDRNLQHPMDATPRQVARAHDTRALARGHQCTRDRLALVHFEGSP